MSKRMELMPGVFLYAMQTDKFKTGSLSVNFLRPLCREEASLNALLPSVLLRGTKSWSDIQQISMHLDELYGASVGTLIRKKGEVHTCGLYADFIEDAYAMEGENVFASVCSFLREVILDPVTENGVFLPDYVESEKVNLCNTIASEINEKRSYAIIRLLRTMCSGEKHAVPRLGERDRVEAITAEQLYEHYRKILATSRVELLYTGKKDPDEVAAQMKLLLKGLPREAITEVGTEVIRAAAASRDVFETMDINQGKLAIGFRTGCICTDSDYSALLLLNTVYGAGVSSKLFRNVREKLSLCYYASSSIERYKGIMVVSSGIEFQNYEIARNEILHQLDECREGLISDEELEQARNYLVSSFRASKDRPGSLDDYYLGQAIVGTSETIDDRVASLQRVTKEQVAAAARKLSLDTVYFLKGVSA